MLVGVLVAVLATALLLGLWWWSRPRPALRLTQTSFARLPGWNAADMAPALAAFRRSCSVLAALPPGHVIGAYAGTAADWQGVCARLPAAGAARDFFQDNFTPYALADAMGEQGLFTGYYEPLIQASRQRHGIYQTPVYGLPADLISADLGAFSPRFQGEHISGRLVGRRLVPYPSRAAIDAQGLASAKILFWCDDPVALFFLQIQGSGRVRLDDGSVERIAFAGENGQPYTAIGRVLIAKGALARAAVTLDSIRAWLKAHPGEARAVMEADQSFVFFQEAPLGDVALGSPGTEGVGLTPRASLAVDTRRNPLGAPYYVAADPVHGLLIGQDTGGAIRGAVRGDIFFGFGAGAEQSAGAMKATGRLFVLLPKAVAARLGSGMSLGADKSVAPQPAP